MDAKKLIKELKDAQNLVIGVHSCKQCAKDLEHIKEHTARGHKD